MKPRKARSARSMSDPKIMKKVIREMEGQRSTVNIIVRMTTEEHRFLKHVKKERGCSINSYIRWLIERRMYEYEENEGQLFEIESREERLESQLSSFLTLSGEMLESFQKEKDDIRKQRDPGVPEPASGELQRDSVKAVGTSIEPKGPYRGDVERVRGTFTLSGDGKRQ